MEAVELFRVFLRSYLRENKKILTQKKLAKIANIGPNHLNDFLRGRKTMGEPNRENICKIIKIDYIEALTMGRDLAIGKEVELKVEPESETISESVEMKEFMLAMMERFDTLRDEIKKECRETRREFKSLKKLLPEKV
jgi:transcriptional regulator with XRE-family HTH domain